LQRDIQALRAAAPHASGRVLEGEPEDRLDGMKRVVRESQELVSELGSLGEIDHTEPQATVDLVELARTAVRSLAGHGDRVGVELRLVTVPDQLDVKVPVRLSPRVAAFLVRTLVAQALAATARGHEVVVTVQAEGVSPGPTGGPSNAGARLLVDDAGASLPANARTGFVGLEVDPSTYGRPTSVALFTCSELASWQGALLELGDAPSGGLRVGLHLPRTDAVPG
jgi:signal transduction histidine kinase